MLFIHQRLTAYPVYFLYPVLFHCLSKFSFNLLILELSNLLLNVWLHPVIFTISPVDHVVLSLFCFPTTAQHVTTHTTFKVTEIAKSVIPRNWLHGGATSFICGQFYLITFVPKQAVKITSIYVSVE